jgi:diguanylate cyclase (GGDEF)-like protein
MNELKQKYVNVLFNVSSSQKRLSQFLWVGQLALLIFVATLASWHIWRDWTDLDRLVNREANIRLETADHIRKWIVGFGGVYAPVSDIHHPNPYIPESVGRDVETTDGRKLTIANSISALNEIMGHDNRIEGAFIRFTGPDPLKKENLPDEWESEALKRLSAGEKRVSGYTAFEGKPYFRMMQPLTLTKKCYKCHDYKMPFALGDIVGGLDVNVDLTLYNEIRTSAIKSNAIRYAVIWLLGALALLLAGHRWKQFLQERDSLNHQLQELAIRDPLTGFLNRHQTEFIFENELARAKRDNTSLSVVIADIDKFKEINDTFGHPAGDEVLKTVSRTLSQLLRESDYLIRYGGDELMFILTSSPHADAMKKAAIINSKIAELVIAASEGDSISVTLSMGASTYPQHGDSQASLIKAADAALYIAKNEGRNRAVSASDI